jgi:hypothetical protein
MKTPHRRTPRCPQDHPPAAHHPPRRLDDAPTAPDPALLDQVADHLAEIISTGIPNQRKTLVGALVDRVIITRPDRLVPVFRIPQTAHVNGPQPINQRKRPEECGSHNDQVGGVTGNRSPI